MRRVLLLIVSVVLLSIGLGAGLSAQDAPAEVVHVVQPGENLFRISLRYNVSIQAIASVNNIPNINLIYAGQQLVIPDGGGGFVPTPTPQPGDPTPVPGDPTPVPTPDGEGTVYIVQPGDTLNRIAQRFGTTVQAIASANGITNVNLIFVGQRLLIPGGSGVVPTPIPGQPTPIPGQPTPGPDGGLTGFNLGGHIASFNYTDTMQNIGMSWVKTQIRWSPGQGPDIAAGAINAARERNMKIVLGVIGEDKSGLAANPAQYYQDFANFLGGVAALGPDAIEVWNEPNIEREWPAGQISGGNYTQMLSAAYQAIKNANPNVVVISGAPAPTGFFGGTCQNSGCDDDIFISQMRNAGAANFMDCVGMHYNEGIVPPSASSGDPRDNPNHYTRYYPTMVNLYGSTFPNKPLCFTELGYLTGEGLGPLPAGFEWAAGTSLQEQAQWLGDAIRLARQGGRVRLLIVWNVDFTNYGADPQAGYAIIRNGECSPACGTITAAMQ